MTPEPTAKRGRKPSLDTLSARTMAHLAENGPTKSTDLKAFMETIAAESSAHAAASKLRTDGLIVSKVWLTPKGLAALREMGWEPPPLEAVEP